jgi:hypothetical protein
MSGTYSSMNINRDQPHSIANAYNVLVDEYYCLFPGFLRRFPLSIIWQTVFASTSLIVISPTPDVEHAPD